jgi:hypothetical protein
MGIITLMVSNYAKVKVNKFLFIVGAYETTSNISSEGL